MMPDPDAILPPWQTAADREPHLRAALDRAFAEHSLPALELLLQALPTDLQAEPSAEIARAAIEQTRGQRQQAQSRLLSLLSHGQGEVRGFAAAVMAAMGWPLHPTTADRIAGLIRQASRWLPAQANWAHGTLANVRGLVALMASDLPAATAQFAEARHRFERAGDPTGVANVVANQGLVALFGGEVHDAIAMCHDTIAAHAVLGRKPPKFVAHTLSQALLMVGDPAGAVTFLDICLSAAITDGDASQEIALRIARGDAYARLGESTAALIDLQAAERQLGSDPDALLRALLTFTRADLARRMGKLPEAAAAVTAGEALLDEASVRFVFHRFEWKRALVAMALGDWARAEAILVGGMQAAEQRQQRWFQAANGGLLAIVLRHLGRSSASAQLKARVDDWRQSHGYRWLPHDDWRGEPLGAIRLRCFGSVNVLLPDDQVLLGYRHGPAARILLALLAAFPEGLPRAEVIDWLYPERDVVDHTLTMLIQRLNRGIAAAGYTGRLIEQVGTLLRFGREVALACDAWEFERLRIQRLDADPSQVPEVCRRLVALYQGRLFHDVPDVPPLVSLRQQAEHAWLAAVESLSAHYRQAGQPEATLELLAVALSVDPFNETLHLARVRLLLDMGLVDLAIDSAATAYRALEQAFGPVPDHPLLALIAAAKATGGGR